MKIDTLYNDVANYTKMQDKISTSKIQRKFGVGYDRASKLVETMEDSGIVSERKKDGFRQVLRRVYVWKV